MVDRCWCTCYVWLKPSAYNLVLIISSTRTPEKWIHLGSNRRHKQVRMRLYAPCPSTVGRSAAELAREMIVDRLAFKFSNFAVISCFSRRMYERGMHKARLENEHLGGGGALSSPHTSQTLAYDVYVEGRSRPSQQRASLWLNVRKRFQDASPQLYYYFFLRWRVPHNLGRPFSAMSFPPKLDINNQRPERALYLSPEGPQRWNFQPRAAAKCRHQNDLDSQQTIPDATASVSTTSLITDVGATVKTAREARCKLFRNQNRHAAVMHWSKKEIVAEAGAKSGAQGVLRYC